MGISPVCKSLNNVHVRDCIPEQKGQPFHINLVRLLINFNLKEFLMREMQENYYLCFQVNCIFMF